MSAAAARPVRVRQLSPLLGCDTLAVYGYRAEAPDGWRGPVRRKLRDARHDAREHNKEGRKAHAAHH